MKLSRIIVFTPDAERLARFYIEAFGLETVGAAEPGWYEVDAGGCTIAFHKLDENSHVRDGWIKPVFGALDVEAERSRLIGLGIRMAEIVTFGDIQLCDGLDPDGNTFQISSRGM